MILCLFLTSCVSDLSQLNRRPFADKVPFVALQPGDYEKAESIGEVKVTHCEKKWLGWFGDVPTFEQLRRKAVAQNGLVYVKDFTSLEWGETGFLGGLSCVGLEGEGYK